MPDGPRYMRSFEVANYLRVTPETVVRWRHSGIGPPYSKVEGVVLYDRIELDEYIASLRRETKRAG